MNRTDLAAAARALLTAQHQGTLSTQSVKLPGYPFGSLMPYALDAQSRPLFFISNLAVHTKNAQADARASLCIIDPDTTLAAPGRLTLLGDLQRIAEPTAAEANAYLAAHPAAAQWLSFGDFAFWRLQTKAIYYVAGFGAMGWLDPADLPSA